MQSWGTPQRWVTGPHISMFSFSLFHDHVTFPQICRMPSVRNFMWWASTFSTLWLSICFTSLNLKSRGQFSCISFESSIPWKEICSASLTGSKISCFIESKSSLWLGTAIVKYLALVATLFGIFPRTLQRWRKWQQEILKTFSRFGIVLFAQSFAYLCFSVQSLFLMGFCPSHTTMMCSGSFSSLLLGMVWQNSGYIWMRHFRS